MKVIVIVGPTAVGKTSFSLDLAKDFAGEIVNADPFSFYRGLDIGTAKPSSEERRQIPHHLIDIANPDETVTLSEFQEFAYATLNQIISRGQLPIIVGGSGLYIKAIIEGYQTPKVPPQLDFRRQMEEAITQYGEEVLHQRLHKVDPTAAEQIDYRNVRRVIRALEVFEVTGVPISKQQKRKPPPHEFRIIGLYRPRSELYARVDARIEMMLAQGFIQEVKHLLEAGYNPTLPSMSAIGYRQITAYLAGEITLKEVIDKMQHLSRKLIRQQCNWFPEDSPSITWLDLSQGSLYEHWRSFLLQVL